MAYLATKPASPDILAYTPADILENFAQLNTQFTIDHDTLLSTGATGKHDKLSFPRRTSDPSLITDTDLDLYCKSSGTVTDLYVRNSTGIYQLTKNGYFNTKVAALCNFDSTGALVGASYNIASIAHPATGHYTVTFTTAMSNANYIIMITAELLGLPIIKPFVKVTGRTANAFTFETIRFTGYQYHDFGCSVKVSQV